MKEEAYTPTRFDIEDDYFDAKLLENVKSGKIHWHSHFLISIFKRNSGKQILNNIECNFERGTAILMGPFDFHYNIIDENESFDAYSIKFTHKIFNQHIYEICNLDSLPIISKLNDKDLELAEMLCERLISEKSKDKSKDQDFFVRTSIEQLTVLIIRNALNSHTQPSSDTTIVKALVYIHDNFKNELSVRDVAEVCHYTPNHFSFRFKKEMGISFKKYLHNLRLDYAYNLIKYGQKSCSEACYESGFNSLEYFSASFKQKFGYSPKSIYNR